MALIALVTVVMLLEYFIFVVMVGMARNKTGIKAPAISGAPEFERMHRVQQNTLEQLIVVLPSLWIFGHYVSENIGAITGLIFVIGRGLYCRAYRLDPDKRGAGFLVGMLAALVLLLGSLYGSVMAVLG